MIRTEYVQLQYLTWRHFPVFLRQNLTTSSLFLGLLVVCVCLHYPSIFWRKNSRSTCHLSFTFSSEFLHLPSCQHGILLQKERSRSVRPYCDVAKPCDHKRTRIKAFAQKFQKQAIPGPISLQPLIKKLPKVINCLESIILYKFMPK